MIKLCVGVESVEDLQSHIQFRLDQSARQGGAREQAHITRVMPKRADEILDGGSLFWVIKGHVQVRQRLVRFDAVEGADGITRCRIVLDPELKPTQWQPKRPFQGWRYFKPEDVPSDLAPGETGEAAMPAHLRRELVALGLM